RLFRALQPYFTPKRLAHIFKKYQKYQKIGEEIDNPENCQELIEAAKCFLDCGEVYDQKPGVPVRDAIPQFIKLH
ncbi:MAG: hypothetical protein P5700_24260, partial [Arthrospira platensis PCC 7345]|nr:hypothetical protein [Limnospira sp. PMC 289.06]MDT9298093.1 hypothetical protein [Arthrospira platensis PCC 7345]MDT9313505.1 hypothetical protein [Limnospira sp. Paracas R14]